MNVLRPEEFTVGTLATAKPVSLLLPRGKYEQAFLVAGPEAEPFAVFLHPGQHRFHGFPSADAHNWSGLIIPDVSVELDQASLYDPSSYDVRLGSLVRSGDTLSVASHQERWMGRYSYQPLISGMPMIEERYGAAFMRWRITIGEGIDRRVLLTVDAGAPNE